MDRLLGQVPPALKMGRSLRSRSHKPSVPCVRARNCPAAVLVFPTGHIHCCTAVAGTSTVGVATQTPSFSGFPLGVTSGTYSRTFDLTLASSFNPSFVTANGSSVAAAEAALVAGIANGKAYLNIHSSFAAGGEIRGFLLPKSIFVDGFEGP